MLKVYNFFGGRKAYLSHLALVLVVGYALITHPSFIEFVSAVGGVLGFGQLTVALEDGMRYKGQGA